jgi:hypothetical protein
MALCASCSGVSNAVDEFATVEVGTGALSPVMVERSFALGPDNIPLCLDVALTLPNSTTTVGLKNTAMGCAITISQPDLVLFDADEVQRARKQTGPFDVDGVRSGSVTVQDLQLSTADGMALAFDQYVDAVSVQIDDDMLLDRTAPSEILGQSGLERELPDSVLDKLKNSVKNNQVAQASVVLTLWLHGQSISNLPDSLKMLLVLQPALKVNVIGAL